VKKEACRVAEWQQKAWVHEYGYVPKPKDS
jgi:hypothetical protein